MGKILIKSTLVALIQAIPTKNKTTQKQNNTRERSEMTTSVGKGTVASVVEPQSSSYSYA